MMEWWLILVIVVSSFLLLAILLYLLKWALHNRFTAYRHSSNPQWFQALHSSGKVQKKHENRRQSCHRNWSEHGNWKGKRDRSREKRRQSLHCVPRHSARRGSAKRNKKIQRQRQCSFPSARSRLSGVGSRVRREISRSWREFAHFDQQCRRHGLPEVLHEGRIRDAARHKPSRSLSADKFAVGYDQSIVAESHCERVIRGS